MAPRVKSKARLVATLGISVFVGYLIFISVLIAREPAPGASSPQNLADALVSGLRAGDRGEVEGLFAENAISDSYVTQLFGRIQGGGDLSAEVVNENDPLVLLLRQSGRPGCLSWGILPEGERFALSGVPPFSTC